jgi:aminoglycoside 6'-N-acetyltransferase
VHFVPLSRANFPLLRSWLDEPLVHRWWNHETRDEALERDFGAGIDHAEPTDYFLAVLDQRPFGLIQRYPIAAYPEYVTDLAGAVDVPDGAMSIDYLIGEPDCRGRGLGAAMITEFVTLLWADFPHASQVIVPVVAGNEASWRALARAGFTRIAEAELEPDNPVDPRDHVIYAIARPDAP